MRATRTIAAMMVALGLVPANASPITSTLSFNASQASNATTSTNACASVSALAAKASAMAKVNSTTPVNVTAKDGALPAQIPAQLAYDCLQSVPINATQATRLVDSLGQFLAFHSGITYLKNPPSSYLMPAIDVYATLDQIRANVTGGSYRGEWDFSVALANLIAQMHDDHMSWNSDAFLSGFNWTRPVALASVSPDGVTLPKVYVYDDLPMLGSNNLTTSNMTTTVSAVAQIDGLEVTDFINQAALWETGEDPDTNYNRVLLNLASYGGGDVNGSFQNPTFYPGANTTVQFENGTTLVYNNTAIVAEDWGHVDSGEAFYAQYCSPKVAPPDNDPSGPGPMEPDMQGYPPAVVRHSTNLVAGFFLDGNCLDTAVLQTNGFSTTTSNLTGKNGGQEFQLVVAEFLAKSAAAGKTKLIVDIQSNGGGDEDPEYDMFKQLFPNNTPYEASEWRAQPVLRAIDQTMDELRKTLLNNATACRKQRKHHCATDP